MEWIANSDTHKFVISKTDNKFYVQIFDANSSNDVAIDNAEYNTYTGAKWYIDKNYDKSKITRFVNKEKGIITKEKLEDLYIKQKMSDREIAKILNLSRDSILKYRKKYKIMHNKENTNETAIKNICLILRDLNIGIEKIVDNDLTLTNGSKVKVFVSHRENKNNNVEFTLRERKRSGTRKNNHRVLLPNGDLKTIFSYRYDFIIFSWQLPKNQYFWIVPADVIDRSTKNGISFVPNNPKTKRFIYQNNWALLTSKSNKEVRYEVIYVDSKFSDKMKAALELEKQMRKDMAKSSNKNIVIGQTRDAIAKKIGIGSGKQYDKAKYVYLNAKTFLIEQIDNNEISIHKAYNILKKEGG